MQEGQRKFLSTFWNTYAFYVLYAEIDQFDPYKYQLDEASLNITDRWLNSRLNSLIKAVENAMDRYMIPEAARAIADFTDELSNWYVRRNRERFWAKGMEQDKINAYLTLHHALVTLAKVSAPFVPFMAEAVYQNLVTNLDKSAPESVHLCLWPEAEEAAIDPQLEASMEAVLKIVVMGRAARMTGTIKNRQPVAKI